MPKKVNGRAKGHAFERFIANEINEYIYSKLNYPEADKPLMRRVPMSGGFDKRNFPGDLLVLDETISKEFILSLECKNYKQWNLSSIINEEPERKFIEWAGQCIQDAITCKVLRIPVLIVKTNRSNIVTMSFIPYINESDDSDNYRRLQVYNNHCDQQIGTVLNKAACYEIYSNIQDGFSKEEEELLAPFRQINKIILTSGIEHLKSFMYYSAKPSVVIKD
jgi:hypothetical protein